MKKLLLTQKLSHKLSPQQIRFMKLLRVPTVDMRARVMKEVEENPVLGYEEASSAKEPLPTDRQLKASNEEPMFAKGIEQSPVAAPFLPSNYTTRKDYSSENNPAFVEVHSLNEQLLGQLSFLKLNKKEQKIGRHLIGSIEGDGYIRRPIEAIVDDLAFTQYIETTEEEVAVILKKIQTFDPAGIGAQDLKECLLLQLARKSNQYLAVQWAIALVRDYFEVLAKKHYEQLSKKLSLTAQQLKEAIEVILKLDPKPGKRFLTVANREVLYPDFIVTKLEGVLQVYLSKENLPMLHIKKSYASLLKECDQKSERSRDTWTFVKEKIKNAQWFIEAIKQRQHTLLRTMNTIVELQRGFFLEENEDQLRPLMLKDVAKEINMDVSTVSRIVSKKSVQTDHAVYPLKFFFPEAISTTGGGVVSNSEVKKALMTIIEREDKSQPHTDEKLAVLLNDRGYNLARRTVAKYREILHLPVARLRKEVWVKSS